MNKIKFIATDMDGTLLNDNKVLPDDFYNVFHALKEKGVIFAAASGRQYHSLVQSFLPIQNEMVFIAENGTLVMHQGKELYSKTMPKEEVHDIIRAVRELNNSAIVLCGKHAAYIETDDKRVLDEIANYYHHFEMVPDLLLVQDDFIKVAVLNFTSTETEVYPFVAPLFADTHQVVVSGKIWLDFMHKEASKGEAIKQLETLFDFTFEQSMSFGDYLNDLEMLKATYHSYAMDNAHAQVKAAARFSAPSNQDAGVIQIIKREVLGEK